MKGLAICLKGVESVTEREISELTGSEAETFDTALIFNVKDAEELAKFCYKAQSVTRVLLLLDKMKVADDLAKTLDKLKKSIKKTDFAGWLKNRTFKVKCKRIGSHNYSSQDIAAGAGEYIIEDTKAKALMTDPDIIVYIYIYAADCYIGIDYSGFELGRRDYKVFTHPNSLNGTVAYSLLRIAGFKKGTISDPFCGSGTIPIEAALYAEKRSPHFFRKDRFAFHRFENISIDKFDSRTKSNSKIFASDYLLKNVKSTKNNAKLAGIGSSIKVTRMDIEWLDTKLDKASLDFIITNPPSVSRLHDEKHIIKLYKEFFYQADFVLKSKGRIVFCVQRDEALKHSLEKFSLVDEYSIWQGGQELKVVVLQKKKNIKINPA